MKIFKRTKRDFIRGLIFSLLAGLFIFIVIRFFANNPIFIYGLTIISVICSVRLTIFSQNIRFEIENNQMRYFKSGHIVNEYDLTNCKVRYRIKTADAGIFKKDDDISIYISDIEKDPNKETYIDCSLIGAKQFHEMLETIQEYGKEKVINLSQL